MLTSPRFKKKKSVTEPPPKQDPEPKQDPKSETQPQSQQVSTPDSESVTSQDTVAAEKATEALDNGARVAGNTAISIKDTLRGTIPKKEEVAAKAPVSKLNKDGFTKGENIGQADYFKHMSQQRQKKTK